MTHEEKTRLIAEFDGWEFKPHGSVTDPKEKLAIYSHKVWGSEYSHALKYHLKYHKSYDWLIPVWHKFRYLRFGDRTNYLIRHANHYQLAKSALCDENIEAFFNALTEAIEWYNTTKK